MKKKMSMKKAALLLGLMSVLAVGGFVFTQHKSVASDEGIDPRMRALFAEPRPVLLETVASASGSHERSYPGTVKASQEALLSFRVSGPLMTVKVQPGDYVKKGEVLMEIDDRDFKDNIQVLQAQLEGARATLENARRDLERSKPLLQEKVIPQASYDATKSAYDNARATVKNLNAQIGIAQHQLEDSKLRAPFDGIISTREAENHEMVSAGQNVMGILDISTLEMESSVPESDIARQPLQPGQKAIVEFATLPGQHFAAELKEWSSSPDPATRTYRVTFTFPAPEGEARILPGMTGELLWEKSAGTGENLSVPLAAVVADEKGTSSVWVYNPATSFPSRRSVELGSLLGRDRITVVQGLLPGEQVVSAGANFVTEDMKLRPLSSPQ